MNDTTRTLSAVLVSAAIACGQSADTSSNASATDHAAALSSDTVGPDEAAFAANVRGTRVNAAAAIKATAIAEPADGMITVVVELDRAPVAVVKAQTPGKKLDAETKATIAADLRKEQEGLRGMIEVLGGTVQNTYQHALNGIRVRLPASKIGALTMLPGVTSVRHVVIYKQDNVLSVPYIGAPTVWKGPPGYHGEGIKVAVIDTGIDYLHANFGGPGTADAYTAAHGGPAGTPAAGDTAAPDPAFFGPNAPKVKGGTDLVGDTYDADPTNATYQPIPHPDPNPLDCAGHGSHVAGTVAGFGVTSAGATFSGSYDDTTDADPTQWKIGPGVAPKADLYAVRVFGCAGSTDVVTDAINWAVANDMDVINMSLGAAYGTEDSSDAIASTNAEEAGTMVVASAGNSGNVPYVVGSPSTGSKTISVAAVDSHQTFAGASLTLSDGSSIDVQINNNAALPSGSLTEIVIPDAAGEPAGIQGVGLGCLDSDYSSVAGKLVVAARGFCARIYRAQAAFKHGAAAVALVNNNVGFGVFEGDIPSCIPGAPADNSAGRPCDPGETPVLVTIPMFGIQGVSTTTLSADAVALKNSSSATAAPKAVTNPTRNQISSFSSAGPRQSYDADHLRSPGGHLKPNVAAPGVSIFSTAVGTGSEGEVISGTSMAAPHTAGLVALAMQAHQGTAFSTDDVRLAVENTSDPVQVVGWRPRRAGAGLIQAFGAVKTQAVAQADTGDGSSLSFGVVELLSDYSKTRTILVRNLSSSTPATFTTSSTLWNSTANRAHTLAIQEPSITVAPGGSARVHVTLTVPAATAGNAGLIADSFTGNAGSSGSMREVGGYITLTPTTGNNGVKLTVPYYFVPRARAAVVASVGRLDRNNQTDSVVKNLSFAPISSLVDYFSWGASGHAGLGPHGIRAVGVKSAPDPYIADHDVVFAISTFKPNSVYVGRIQYQVDITFARGEERDDGSKRRDPDITAFTTDIDEVLSGTPSGRVGVIVIDHKSAGAICAGVTPPCAFAESIAGAPTDGSTVLIPLFAADVGLNTHPKFTYTATSVFTLDDPTVPPSSAPLIDTTPPVRFDASDPALTATVDGGTLPLTLAPGAQARVKLTVKSGGVMIVPSDNPGLGQALLFPLRMDERESRWSLVRN